MLSFVDKALSKIEKEAIDTLYARYVHLKSHSFDPLSCDEGIAFLRKLRPAYINAGGPPSREQVAGRYLIAHEKDVMGKVVQSITEARAVALTTDGWTDANSASLHNIMVCTPTPFLLGAIRHPGGREDSTSLFEAAKEMAGKVISLFDDKKKPHPLLIGFCTDSPNGNKGMREMLLKDKDSMEKGIIPYGCVCHGLNNFGKDICNKFDKIANVIAQAKVVAQVFRNVKFAKFHLNALQKERRGKTLQVLMPVETRWNSNMFMIERLLQVRDELVTVCTRSHHGTLDPPIDLDAEFGGSNIVGLNGEQVSVYKLVTEPLFWKRLAQCRLLLAPIARAVTYLEGDMVPISSVPALFIKLYRTFKELATQANSERFPFTEIGLQPADFEDRNSHNSKTLPDLLRRRWSEMTFHKVNPKDVSEFSGLLTLALYLDPATKKLLNSDSGDEIRLDKSRTLGQGVIAGANFLFDRIKACNQIPNGTNVSTTITQIMKDVSSRGQSAESDRDFLASMTDDVLAHPMLYHALNNSVVALMATVLFSLPCSAAGGERAFSVYGATHTKKRNRMANDKLDDLAKLRFNSKQLKCGGTYDAASSRTKQTILNFYEFNIMKGDEEHLSSDEDPDDNDDVEQ